MIYGVHLKLHGIAGCFVHIDKDVGAQLKHRCGKEYCAAAGNMDRGIVVYVHYRSDKRVRKTFEVYKAARSSAKGQVARDVQLVIVITV